MAGSEKTQQSEWGRLDFYSLILTRAASYLGEPLFKYLKDTVLRAFGTDEIYDGSALKLDNFFGASVFHGLVERAIQEGIQPPFSDAGPGRSLGGYGAFWRSRREKNILRWRSTRGARCHS